MPIEAFLKVAQWDDQDLSLCIERSVEDIQWWKKNKEQIPLPLIEWMKKVSEFLENTPPPRGFEMERKPDCILNIYPDSVATCNVCSLC